MCTLVLVACGGNKASPDAAGDGAKQPQCSDGIDNDGDGKIDYPNDPGCLAPNQDDEQDTCPDGPGCPQCADGVDNDGNGKTDFPDDPGCTSASDSEEFTPNPNACGQGLMIKQLPASGDDTITFDATSTSTLVAGTCGGGQSAPAIAYELHITKPTVVVATTDLSGTGVDTDTVLDLRGVMCTADAAEVACNNDVDPGNNLHSTLTASVPPGVYYLIVEGFDSTVTGAVQLHVDLDKGEGASCASSDECGPGLVCRVPMGMTQMVCTKPMCSDGVDDDGDGKADYPDDPGCTDGSDNDETDDCPSGPMCPQCGNGVDDDGDGKVDYPNDPSCIAASSTSESCPGEQDPIMEITGATTTGDLTTAHNDQTPSCQSINGPDLVYSLTVPKLRRLTLTTDTGTAFDTVLSVLTAACRQPDLACNDDDNAGTTSTVSVGNVDAGTYMVVVDSYGNTTLGPFTLTMSGELAPGDSCEPANTLGGALVCPSSSPCVGTTGMRKCQVTQCNDGIDNDGDGKIDFPDDPGCTDPYDTTETDACPSGAGCPVCSNGNDDDSDTKTDYAMDVSCWAASGTNEGFCPTETDRVGLITDPTTTGTTTGGHDNFAPSCSGTSNNDATYALNLPVAVATLTIDTNGSAMGDTVLMVHNATCATELACDDDSGDGSQSLVTMTSVAAGSYAVTVDGYGTHVGGFQINVHGVVNANAACTSTLFKTGVLVCPTGTMCTTGTCH